MNWHQLTAFACIVDAQIKAMGMQADNQLRATLTTFEIRYGVDAFNDLANCMKSEVERLCKEATA